MTPEITPFFDTDTFTYSYVVADPATRRCAIVDSVLDFDPASGRTSKAGADRIVAFVRERGLGVDWILETHVHADHLTAASFLKATLGGRTGIGSGIPVIQKTFGAIFNAGPDFATDGRQFDHLFADDERFAVGSIEGRVLHTPGHTPACVTFIVGNCAFVGDTLFMPDYGTARCDFPGGDARTLYRSIRRLLTLPDDTRVFMCHDYLAAGRTEYQCETSIAAERTGNVHVHEGIDEDAFVAMRSARDAKLNMPRLILPSVQVNMRAGDMPPAEDNGIRYLKVPVDAL
jgi:glyoxylase-like metal-dependent hydrolase (beta-lactamase superfamily II)